MLASELALGGARVQLLEERVDKPNITRAFAVHARTLELLDARGMADELMTRGVPVYDIAPPAASLPAGAADQIRMLLVVPQRHRAGAADAGGRPRCRSCAADVVGLTQDDDGVTVQCRHGTSRPVRRGTTARTALCGSWSGSVSRGKQYETHILLADVHLTRAPRSTLTGVTNERGAADDPVRRRLVPRHRVGPPS